MSETVEQHFVDRGPAVRRIYDRLLQTTQRFGSVVEDPKKTSIHLVRKTAFAGVATRREAVILTIKSSHDIESPRVLKHEQTSTNRWHLEVRLDEPAQVDGELKSWLKAAFDLAG